MHLTYRQQRVLAGALVGAVIGVVVALVLMDDEGEGKTIGWRELAQLAATVGALVRQVNELTGAEQ